LFSNLVYFMIGFISRSTDWMTRQLIKVLSNGLINSLIVIQVIKYR
jgi:hypothetical protein